MQSTCISVLRRTRKSLVDVYRRKRKFYLSRRSRPTLARLGILAHFDDYPRAAHPPQYADLLGIYRLILQRKPAVVIELGGGCSTFAFAHAIRDLHSQGVHIAFYSVDESDYWQQVVKDRMPRELTPFVHFWRATPTLIEVDGEKVSAFDHLPFAAANLVCVDGGLVPGNSIGADAVRLEALAPADYAILVDNRKETVAFLKRTLKARYRLSRGPMGTQTLFTRSNN